MRNVLSVSLPEKMARELNHLALETGRNKSDMVKESLGNFLWGLKLQKARDQFYVLAKERHRH